MVTFPSGAIFRTGHLKDRSSYEKYLGHEYPRILIEELTLIPQESYYTKVLGSCRSTIPELKPKIFCTSNPDGPGHAWVKRRFIDMSSWGKEFIAPETGRTRIFIPSTIDDNPILKDRDPGYVKYLDGLKLENEELWKAWRLGDWDIFVGQVFREFLRSAHVVAKPDINLDRCKRIITFDWGYNAPGCALWLAVAPEDRFGIQRVYAYRELYQNQKTPEQWANEVSIFTEIEPTEFMVLPRDCFASPQGGRSIASIFQSKINTRIIEGESLTRAARVNRQAVTHQFLSNARDGRPNLYILERCQNLIRTLPELVYDEVDVELVDCFVRGTEISTSQGERNVEDIKVGDMVSTPIGNRRVTKAGISGKSEKVVSVYLSDGRVLRGTANHKVYVKYKGLVELQNLEISDILMERNSKWQQSILNIMAQLIYEKTILVSIIQNFKKHYILRFIWIIMGIFQRAGIFITRMEISTTIPLRTYRPFRPTIMQSSMLKKIMLMELSSISGIIHRQVKNNYEKTPKRYYLIPKLEHRRAAIVELLFILDILHKFFVRIVRSIKDLFTLYAPFVAKNSFAKRMGREPLKPVHIIAVGNIEEDLVYHLTVDDAHLYFANNFLVTNTEGEDHAFDALGMGLVTIKQRYKLLSGPIDPLKKSQGKGFIITKDGYSAPDFWEEMKSRQSKKPSNPEMR